MAGNLNIPLETKVAFLSQPEAYGGSCNTVEARQTHMSWVFLTENFAYKLKKPVRLAFLDFRSLAARRRTCVTEVHLNRRLAKDVYLGAVPLCVGSEGRLRLGAERLSLGNDPERRQAESVVDWLVKMRRLPDELMLDRAIEKGTVDREKLRSAGHLLARFYEGARRPSIEASAYVERLHRDIEDNAKALKDGLPSQRLRAVTNKLNALTRRERALFEERIRDGWILEGHGDLRPEHIALGPPPAIIDCLEFNRAFRILDVADELAFLRLECTRLGASWVGQTLLDVCWAHLGCEPPEVLLGFYTAARALLRAKLALWHIPDAPEQIEKWQTRAMDYLGLAENSLQHVRAD